MAPKIPMILALALVSGCTIERIHHDARAGLDYLRITNATHLTASSRWQISPNTGIAVSDVSPAADEEWLASAREGVASVFGLGAPTTADLDLIVAWPGDRLESADRPGYIRYLRIDKLISGADPLSVQVFLCDARTQTLIQSATLDMNPRWLSSEGNQQRHIRDAFRRYAENLVTRY